MKYEPIIYWGFLYTKKADRCSEGIKEGPTYFLLPFLSHFSLDLLLLVFLSEGCKELLGNSPSGC